MAKMTEMKELLTHELGDLLYAERRFLTATRRLKREAEDPEIKTRLERHVRETEKQIERLDRAFEAIGEKAKAEECEAAIGLREEHYEIASYRSAIAVAKSLGENECADILKESLAEEEAMAKFLEQNAARVLEGIQRTMQEQ